MTKALAPHFTEVRGYDIHEDLVLMWQALLAGWTPPSVVTEEDYARLRAEPPSALRGFVGFGCSFAGKWWGGYARYQDQNFADETRRSLAKALDAIWANTTIERASYDEIEVPAGATVYADPPYAGTTGYSHGFDNDAFWRTAAAWADAGARVFVSEYRAPEGWERVWSSPFTRGLRSAAGNAVTESLFYKPAYGGY